MSTPTGAHHPTPPPADKSVGAALALTFFFGPFGLLYTTVAGAVVMIIIGLVVAFFTVGLGLFILWPIVMVWSAVSASNQHQQFETWKVAQLAGGGAHGMGAL